MRRARSPAEHGFNRYDEPRLKEAMKRAADECTFRRVQAVLVVAQGRTIKGVGGSVGVTVQTVYNWMSLYLAPHQGGALIADRKCLRPLAK